MLFKRVNGLRVVTDILVLFFLFLSIVITNAYAIDKDSYVDIVREQSLSALKVVAEPTMKLGTGLVIDISTDTTKAVFITNKHIVQEAKKLTVTYQLSDESKNIRDTASIVVDLYSDSGDSLFVVPETNADIAAVVINLPKAKKNCKNVWLLKRSSFTDFKDLYPGETVLFFGYPLGITVNKFEPILRRGTIAGIDSISNVVLLDAQSFGGSSGSPVFVDEAGLLQSTPCFVGVISGYIPFKKHLQNVDSKEIEMIQTENSGIAVVMPASEIEKIVQKAFGRLIRK